MSHDPQPTSMSMKPDRILLEVDVYPVMHWAELRVNVLDLPKGPTRLEVRALAKKRKTVMDLQTVLLKRLA